MKTEPRKFSSLVGLTFIQIGGMEVGSEEINLVTDTGRKFTLFHEQDCCENVDIAEIWGDVSDILNSPILSAEESISTDYPLPEGRPWDDAIQWTFYKLRTIKGSLDLRWLGTSNGYYSVSVELIEHV